MVLVARSADVLLINCAGVIQVGPIERMTAADCEEAMATHFWTPYVASKFALVGLSDALRAELARTVFASPRSARV